MSTTSVRPMKNSGVDWLGEVPETWSIQALRHLALRVKRTVVDEEIVTAFRDGQVTRRSNRRTDGFTEATDYSGYQGIEPGDLVIHAMDAFAGSVGVSDSSGRGSPVLSVCEPRPYVNAHYMANAIRLMSQRGWIEALSRSIRERTSEFRWSDASAQIVPLPSLSEQNAIMGFLDRETAQIDALIAKQQQLIETLAERRKAVITRAVTSGLDPTVPMKPSGYRWLGSVPVSWRVIPIKRAATTGAGSGFPVELQGIEDEEITFLKVNSLSRASAKGLITSRDDTVSRATARTLNAKIFSAGSIVLAKIGAALLLGRIRMVGHDSCIDNNMMAMAPMPDTDGRFLFFALNLIEFDFIVNPGTIPSTSEGAVGKFHLAFPPHLEQVEIATYLDKATDAIDNLMSKAGRVVDVLKERRQALISAAVTGKIDVREKGL